MYKTITNTVAWIVFPGIFTALFHYLFYLSLLYIFTQILCLLLSVDFSAYMLVESFNDSNNIYKVKKNRIKQKYEILVRVSYQSMKTYTIFSRFALSQLALSKQNTVYIVLILILYQNIDNIRSVFMSGIFDIWCKICHLQSPHSF